MARAADLKIYEHAESVCCHKVAITVAEKQIPCEVINIALELQEQRSPWFLAINPLGMVPVIVHHGRTIVHSTLMTEYLDDAFPGTSLMPTDPYLRYRRRYWARRIDDGLHVPHIAAISFIIAFGEQFRARMNTPEKLAAYFDNIKDARYRDTIRSWYESDVDSPLLRQSLKAYRDFIDEMEAALGETEWLAGDAYSLADIDVVPYLARLANLQLDMLWVDRPKVADWYERATSRPAFQKAIVSKALPDWINGMKASGERARPVLTRMVAGLDGRKARETVLDAAA